MRSRRWAALCGASSAMLAAASAQGQAAADNQAGSPTPRATSQASDTTGVSPDNAASVGVGQDIIVTARRREESLQDVPQTVEAVTGNTVEKLNILKFEDIQSVVPGLTLTSGATGYSTAATIRGASFSVESGATPTVEFYINDALTQSVFLFQSLYDVGQIEVLKGPQGTLRGRASPSGSITFTTHRPDLEEVGGYADMTGTTKNEIDANAAINLPIVKDVLAIRVAGIVDQNDLDHVRSVNDGQNPYSRTSSERASLRFEPADFLRVNLTYQHLYRSQLAYQQVESLSLIDPAAVDTGPIITSADRRGITNVPNTNTQRQDLATANVDVRVAGQKLTYVGSYTKLRLHAVSAGDLADAFPQLSFAQDLQNRSRQWTHEIRLASEERLFGFLDYTVGAFHSDFKPVNALLVPTQVVFPAGPGFFVPVLSVNTPVTTEGRTKETSEFANLTAHIGDRTELSGGVRHIDFETTNVFAVAGNAIPLADPDKKDRPTVYNFSLSHRFSDALLAYANTGSSFRQGPFVVGVFRPLNDGLEQFVNLKAETSKSYEVGVKANFLDHRLRTNLAGYYQNFHNFLYRGGLVNYVNQTFVDGAFVNVPATFNFDANVPARIAGLDFDSTFQATRRLSMGVAFSYAHTRIKNGLIPCNDLNGDGIPDAEIAVPTDAAQISSNAGGNAVASCRFKGRLTTSPSYNLTAQSEYDVPLSNRVDGYVRGLFTYYPRNPGDPLNPYDRAHPYGLLNLYVGIRSPRGAWEVSLFGKNLTDTGTTLTRNAVTQSTPVQVLQPPTFGTVAGESISSGYLGITRTAPREFGLNIRYAFGSR